MWPSFDVILVDQVSAVIPVLKLKRSMKVIITGFCIFQILMDVAATNMRISWLFVQVVFYCHFPDLLLAKHTTLLRMIYRKPIDFLEERTTGILLHFAFF